MNKLLLNKTLESIQRGENNPELIHSMFKLMSKQPVGKPKLVKKLDQGQLDFLKGIETPYDPYPDETFSRSKLPDITPLHDLEYGLLSRIGESVKINRYDIELKKAKRRTEQMIQAFLDSIDLEEISNTIERNFNQPIFKLRWNIYLDQRINLPPIIKAYIDETIEENEFDVDPLYGGDNNWGDVIKQLRGWYGYRYERGHEVNADQIIYDFVNSLRETIMLNTDYTELETEQFIQILLSHLII